MSAPVHPDPYRVLLAGSRTWTDTDPISACLRHLHAEHGDRLLVVHGNCRTGGDRIARTLCDALGIAQETHDADWDRHGRAAGPIRNQRMVQLGAQLCLAFPTSTQPSAGASRGTVPSAGASRGTWGLVGLARAAGIEVHVHQPEPRPADR